MAATTLDPQRLVRVTAGGAIAPTLSDSVDEPTGFAHAGLYTITAGNVKFTDSMGVDHALTAVPAFTRIPIVPKRVWSTGTTASVLLLN